MEIVVAKLGSASGAPRWSLHVARLVRACYVRLCDVGRGLAGIDGGIAVLGDG